MEEPITKCKELGFEHLWEGIQEDGYFISMTNRRRRDKIEQCKNCGLIKQTKWEATIEYLLGKKQ